jgi:hypothetical protein
MIEAYRLARDIRESNLATIERASLVCSICQDRLLGVDLPPVLRQPVKTQNPSNGELSHGIVS